MSYIELPWNDSAIMNAFAVSIMILGFSGLFFSCQNANGLVSPRPGKRIHRSDFDATNNEKTVVLLYNKPPNVVTSHVSGDSRSTVFEQVESMVGFQDAKGRKGISFEQATGIR